MHATISRYPCARRSAVLARLGHRIIHLRSKSPAVMISVEVATASVETGELANLVKVRVMTESSFRRLLLRFALVPLLALCAFVTILGVQISQIVRRRIQASQATTILLQSDRVLKSMIDEETGIRGFLVAQDPLFLQPYREASLRFGEELSVLSSLASTTPSLSGKVVKVASSFNDFDAINKALLDSDLAHDTVIELLRRQKQAMDTLRTELANVTAEASNSREVRRREINTLDGTRSPTRLG
jgi:CHASE3 domain sensor protein